MQPRCLSPCGPFSETSTCRRGCGQLFDRQAKQGGTLARSMRGKAVAGGQRVHLECAGVPTREVASVRLITQSCSARRTHSSSAIAARFDRCKLYASAVVAGDLLTLLSLTTKMPIVRRIETNYLIGGRLHRPEAAG